MSCGVGHRHGLDPLLLWLWCRPAAAALIQPLNWERPCAASAAPKKTKKKKKEKKKKNPTSTTSIYEISGAILGLTHWVKDLVLP